VGSVNAGSGKHVLSGSAQGEIGGGMITAPYKNVTEKSQIVTRFDVGSLALWLYFGTVTEELCGNPGGFFR
jgi:hypothetical protein